DKLAGSTYVPIPTTAEPVARAGGRPAIATAKTVGLLLDRQIRNRSTDSNGPASPLGEGERMKVRGSITRDNGEAQTLTLPSPLRRERRTNSESETKIDSQGAKNSVTLFAGKSLPAEILPWITETLRPFPPSHLQQALWTTKALTDFFWKDG